MPDTIIYDYFYGDEAEQFNYFRIPRLLITNPRFKFLSAEAKLLYGMMLVNIPAAGNRHSGKTETANPARGNRWSNEMETVVPVDGNRLRCSRACEA